MNSKKAAKIRKETRRYADKYFQGKGELSLWARVLIAWSVLTAKNKITRRRH